MNFELRALPLPEKAEKTYWFIFHEDKLLVEHEDEAANIPFTVKAPYAEENLDNMIYLGRMDSYPCYAAQLRNAEKLSPEHSSLGVRQLHGLVEDDMFWLAARASHLVNWSRNNTFCGRCGAKTEFKAPEHAKLCPACDYTIYPKISPAVIVAVTKENKLLLAKNRLSAANYYSVLAGFVEPGENLEDCVRREIKEEAGIDVKNIKYFGSQPWPFPDSLMIGFTAEYAGGELTIDKQELSDANWFSAEEMPPVPGKLSISRRLIDWFAENHK
jgi:NAD+ diphosphatase